MSVSNILVAELTVKGFISGAKSLVNSTNLMVAALVEANRAITKMENTLITSSGSLRQSKSDVLQLREMTDRLGISLEASVTPFAKFSAAADGLSRIEKFTVFEGFATALSGVHASAKQVSGTFLALQQIMSKGKVNMQDLRRQLAEHIPGAMEMARLAFKDGTASQEEFNAAVREGLVNANEWVVEFAKLMTEKFGGAAVSAAKSLNAEVARSETAWLVFKNSVVESSNSVTVWKNLLILLQQDVLNSKNVQLQLGAALGEVNKAIGVLIGNLPAMITFLSEVTRLSVGTAKFMGQMYNELATSASAYGNIIATVFKAAKQTLFDFSGTAAVKSKEVKDSMGLMINAHEDLDAAMMSSHDTYEQSVKDEFALGLQRVANAQKVKDELIASNKEEADQRYTTLRDMYNKTNEVSREFVALERQRLTEIAKGWSEWMTEAERLAWVDGELKKLTESTNSHKASMKKAKEETDLAKVAAKKLAQEEEKAAVSAAKLAANQKKVTVETNNAANAAANLATQTKKAADASAAAIAAGAGGASFADRNINQGGDTVVTTQRKAGGSSFEGPDKIFGSGSETHSVGGSFEMSAAEQELWLSMTPAGRGDDYYKTYGRNQISKGWMGTGSGDKSTTHDYLDEILMQQDAARAAIFANRNAQGLEPGEIATTVDPMSQFSSAANPYTSGGANITNNFTQSLSRSDVTNIISETARTEARA